MKKALLILITLIITACAEQKQQTTTISDYSLAKDTHQVYGVLKRYVVDGVDQWVVFEDETHISHNIKSVEVFDVDPEFPTLRVTFKKSFKLIGSFQVDEDDAYIQTGVMAGASVNTYKADIYLSCLNKNTGEYELVHPMDDCLFNTRSNLWVHGIFEGVENE